MNVSLGVLVNSSEDPDDNQAASVATNVQSKNGSIVSDTGGAANVPSLPSYINELFLKAYEAPLVFSDGGDHSSSWPQRWAVIIQQRGLHYSLLGGAIAKSYVAQLADKIYHLCNGVYPADACWYLLLFTAM